MDILEPFFHAPEGLSLLADNKEYLSRIYRDGRQRIEAAKDIKDPYKKFLVTKSSDGKRILLQADNGSYCSLILRENNIYYLEAAKRDSDPWCEFEVFNYSGKLVLKGQNGLFVSRILRDNVQSIEAAKDGIDSFSQFIPGIGDPIPPKFEILDVTWDSSGGSILYNPVVVTEDTYENDASNAIKQEIDLTWTKTVKETTTWKFAWGFEESFTFKTGVLDSLVADYEFQAKISYNGSYGKSSSEENKASFERKLTIIAAPFKKTTVKMVVQKADNVKLPFTATICRTNADGSQHKIHKKGKWQGVSYQSVFVKVEEQDL